MRNRVSGSELHRKRESSKSNVSGVECRIKRLHPEVGERRRKDRMEWKREDKTEDLFVEKDRCREREKEAKCARIMQEMI